MPQITRGHNALSLIAGIAYVALGVFLVLYGTHRARAVRDALDRDEFSYPDPRLLTALAAAGVTLGGLTIAIVATT